MISGCRRRAEAAGDPSPEVPVVTDSSSALMFTWFDDKGEFHVEERVADVPAEQREWVKVTDPARETPSGERMFVADLRSATDGGYPVRVVLRKDFEDRAVVRRAKHGSVLEPRLAVASAAPDARGANGASGAASGDVAARPAVIIYGASWCGACHQAAAYLKKRGIPFVEHDIEQDSSAAREMQTKLAKAGGRGGSIPVIDVRGRILIGFDANAIEQALAKPL
jgi:glutaredoxin